MPDLSQTLAALFVEAGHAHHEAFLATDGDDPEWPLWYADYLHEKLTPLFSQALTKSTIVYLLIHADKTHQATAPDTAWPDYYAYCFIEEVTS